MSFSQSKVQNLLENLKIIYQEHIEQHKINDILHLHSNPKDCIPILQKIRSQILIIYPYIESCILDKTKIIIETFIDLLITILKRSSCIFSFELYGTESIKGLFDIIKLLFPLLFNEVSQNIEIFIVLFLHLVTFFPALRNQIVMDVVEIIGTLFKQEIQEIEAFRNIKMNFKILLNNNIDRISLTRSFLIILHSLDSSANMNQLFNKDFFSILNSDDGLSDIYFKIFHNNINLVEYVSYCIYNELSINLSVSSLNDISESSYNIFYNLNLSKLSQSNPFQYRKILSIYSLAHNINISNCTLNDLLTFYIPNLSLPLTKSNRTLMFGIISIFPAIFKLIANTIYEKMIKESINQFDLILLLHIDYKILVNENIFQLSQFVSYVKSGQYEINTELLDLIVNLYKDIHTGLLINEKYLIQINSLFLYLFNSQ